MLKHAILSRYLAVFATKASTNAEGKRVYFLDGYAGRGDYEDGTPGSPVIAMDVSDALRGSARPRDLRCIFVEEDPALARQLQSLVSTRDGDHTVHHGTIQENLADIADEVRDWPLFALLG